MQARLLVTWLPNPLGSHAQSVLCNSYSAILFRLLSSCRKRLFYWVFEQYPALSVGTIILDKPQGTHNYKRSKRTNGIPTYQQSIYIHSCIFYQVCNKLLLFMRITKRLQTWVSDYFTCWCTYSAFFPHINNDGLIWLLEAVNPGREDFPSRI